MYFSFRSDRTDDRCELLACACLCSLDVCTIMYCNNMYLLYIIILVVVLFTCVINVRFLVFAVAVRGFYSFFFFSVGAYCLSPPRTSSHFFPITISFFFLYIYIWIVFLFLLPDRNGYKFVCVCTFPWKTVLRQQTPCLCIHCGYCMNVCVCSLRAISLR